MIPGMAHDFTAALVPVVLKPLTAFLVHVEARLAS